MRKNQARNDEEKIGLVSAAAASSVVPDNETTTYETHHLADTSPTAATTRSTPRSYGSLATTRSQTTQTPAADGPSAGTASAVPFDAHSHITYSWSNIDVYGEVSQPQPFWQHAAQRLRHLAGLLCYCSSCCTPSPSAAASDDDLSTGQPHKRPHHHPTARKHLLKNVSGLAEPGQLLAIMGSSGAGKTTLLNALAFRSPPGIQIAAGARRAINGRSVRADELRTRCAYVQQEDLFIGSLTAREHLVFQAMLRIGRGVTYAARMQRVAEVLRELSLTECADTVIGTLGRTKGLSGGERKRLAFASESLTDPALLLCDEPTSGLDSFMAHSVLQVLRRMAANGKTVVLTIHQPSSELYALFDKLQLMAEGRVAFLGTPAEADAFFNRLLEAPCPSNYNPADFYVQLLAMVPGRETESGAMIRRVCDAYAGSQVGRAVQRAVARNERWNGASSREETDGNGIDVEGGGGPPKRKSGGWRRRQRRQRCRASWWTQFRVILWRSWLSVLKEPMLVRVRLIQTVMIAVLIGVIFFGQTLDQDGVMNMNGAIFLFLTNMTFQNVFSVINVFCAELPVFLRESRSNLYRTDTYFLGKTVAELPLFVIIPIIFTTITYPMIGLRPDFGAFGIAMALVTLVANVSTSFGYFISCASSSISMALSIGPPIIIPFLLFGGYFLNAGSVPAYFEWLSYLSWFRYGNEGLLINQWATLAEGQIACTRPNATCPASGHVILETLNFDENNLPYDFLGLALLIVGFRVAAYVALVIRARSTE